jgi:WD40 repeat protein
MIPECSGNLDEQFASKLAACDEELASGVPGSRNSVENTAPELQPRLDRALACLRLLGQIWPAPPRAPSSPNRLQERSSPEPLRNLGRFEIRRELGRGGFGVVFLAYDPLLGREIALKIPHPDVLVSPARRRRFHHEAQAAARLDHPHIVSVFEAGEIGPICYIASAYCPGTTLAAWLQRHEQSVPWSQAAGLVATLADAVQHAHSRGVLHRDLKPANILLVQGPKSKVESRVEGPWTLDLGLWTPRIADFGLAKLVEEEEGAGGYSALSHMGAILGTASYMAPEQAEGNTKAVGTAADVYALGAILYELLTGRTVFQGDSALAVLEQVRTQDPLPPRRLLPRLPRDLDTICLKCLEKHPLKRYASAHALAEDLRHWLAGEPVRARPIGAWERGVRWARRRPALAGLAGVSIIATLAVVGAVVGLWYSGQLQSALQEAVALRAEADRQRLRADEQRARAEEVERRVRYARDMNLAYQTWQDSHLGRLTELLESWAPGRNGQPDLRGWEWHYLRGLCGAGTILRAPVHYLCLASSPHGRYLAAGTVEGSVRLWDVAITKEIGALEGHSGDVNGVTFSPDGAWLASAGADGTVRLWDLARRQQLHRHDLPGGQVISVSFGTGGQLASGSGDGAIRLWRTEKSASNSPVTAPDAFLRSPPLILRSHRGKVTSVVFSPDGTHLASSSVDASVKIWDSQTGQEKLSWKGGAAGAGCLVFDPRGFSLAGVSDDDQIKIWDRHSGRELHTLRGHNSAIRCLAVSPDGSFLASAGQDRAVKIWSLADGLEIRTLRGHREAVFGLAFTPDAGHLASADATGAIRLWDPKADQGVQTLRGHTNQVGCVVFSPDGRRLATAGWDKVIKLWDLASGQEISSLVGHSAEICQVAFSPQGDLLASCGWEGSVKLWSVAAGGRDTPTFRGHSCPVRCVAFPPAGTLLASAGFDGTIRMWDYNTGRQAQTWKAHNGEITGLTYSPDGRVLASACGSEAPKLWDPANGRLLGTLGSKTPCLSVAFSPDGQWLAGGTLSAEITIWDSATRLEKTIMKGHTQSVISVAFSPDGRRLASAGYDKTVRLWDTASGLETLTLTDHALPVVSVAFSPDGRRLASASGHVGRGEVKIWDSVP